jgi:Flp pilus assembly protein TadG
MCDANIVKSERGQIVIVLALVLPILILIAGLAIDVGILYATKAKLSTSVDAACLTAMKNLSLGQTTAAELGTGIFNANFGANPPTPSVTFPIDTHGGQQVKVTATAYVNTFFMQYLSQWASVPVGATAVATRGKLVMSIVLDRSGSMCGGTEHCDTGVTGDNGGEALKAAVPLFVGNFDNSATGDELAMGSFSSNATVDYTINYSFKTPITNAVNALSFTGGTFGTGAGTAPIQSNTMGAPLSLAQVQNGSVPILPGQNIVKVIVYFTDGLMNTIQDKFHCGGTTDQTLTLINYGGHDSGSQVDFFDPTSATTDWGHYTSGTGFPYTSGGAICKDINGNIVTKFPSQSQGTQVTLSQSAVTADAKYRAIQTAIALRTESPVPTYIFTIGLGTGVTTTTQAFLAQLANDPNYPATYIKGQPAGLFFYIPSCTGSALTACKSQLNTAFQTIAAKVLLRLTS